MKKKLIIVTAILGLLIFLILNFGIQIGDVRIGKQMDLKTSQNNNFELSDFYTQYYSQENLIVFNVWATWCIPCIEEMPELNSIKKHFKNEPIEFLSLSIDNDSIRLVKFLKKNKFKFKDITLQNLAFRDAILNTLENRETDTYIATRSIPKTYLIKSGKILTRIEGQIDKERLMEVISKYK